MQRKSVIKSKSKCTCNETGITSHELAPNGNQEHDIYMSIIASGAKKLSDLEDDIGIRELKTELEEAMETLDEQVIKGYTSTDDVDIALDEENNLSVKLKTVTYEIADNELSRTITHNLGRIPNVHVVDSAGTEVGVAVTHLSVNELRIDSNAVFSGLVYLS